MFNKNSGLVLLWVQNVERGLYTKEQVPKLSNLQEIVFEVLDEKEQTA